MLVPEPRLQLTNLLVFLGHPEGNLSLLSFACRTPNKQNEVEADAESAISALTLLFQGLLLLLQLVNQADDLSRLCQLHSKNHPQKAE